MRSWFPGSISAGTILQMVRASAIWSRIALIEEGKGRFLEFDVGEEAEVVGRRIADLPRLERRARRRDPAGRTGDHPDGRVGDPAGDRVIVIALPISGTCRDEEVWCPAGRRA